MLEKLTQLERKMINVEARLSSVADPPASWWRVSRQITSHLPRSAKSLITNCLHRHIAIILYHVITAWVIHLGTHEITYNRTKLFGGPSCTRNLGVCAQYAYVLGQIHAWPEGAVGQKNLSRFMSRLRYHKIPGSSAYKQDSTDLDTTRACLSFSWCQTGHSKVDTEWKKKCKV
jgi:hypothetical protein